MTSHRGIAVVIEDDPDVSGLLSGLLAQAGFDVLTVHDGFQGVEAVRLNAPLITTVDLGIPGIDGIEVVKRIRPLSPGYILMISGTQDELDVLEGLGAGADAWIAKPFRPREFRARIDSILRRASQEFLDAAAKRTAVLEEPKPEQPVRPSAEQLPYDLEAEDGTDAVEPSGTPLWTMADSTRDDEDDLDEYDDHDDDYEDEYDDLDLDEDDDATPVDDDPADYSDDETRDEAEVVDADAPDIQAEEAEEEDLADETDEAGDELFEDDEPEDDQPKEQVNGTALGTDVLRIVADQPVDSRPDDGEADESWEHHMGLSLHRSLRRVEVDGRPVDLTGPEFDVLVSLLDSGRRIRSRSELSQFVTRGHPDPTHYLTPVARRSTDALMSSLLAKLGESHDGPRWIEAVPGVGYRRTAR